MVEFHANNKLRMEAAIKLAEVSKAQRQTKLTVPSHSEQASSSILLAAPAAVSSSPPVSAADRLPHIRALVAEARASAINCHLYTILESDHEQLYLLLLALATARVDRNLSNIRATTQDLIAYSVTKAKSLTSSSGLPTYSYTDFKPPPGLITEAQQVTLTAHLALEFDNKYLKNRQQEIALAQLDDLNITYVQLSHETDFEFAIRRRISGFHSAYVKMVALDGSFGLVIRSSIIGTDRFLALSDGVYASSAPTTSLKAPYYCPALEPHEHEQAYGALGEQKIKEKLSRQHQAKDKQDAPSSTTVIDLSETASGTPNKEVKTVKRPSTQQPLRMHRAVEEEAWTVDPTSTNTLPSRKPKSQRSRSERIACNIEWLCKQNNKGRDMPHPDLESEAIAMLQSMNEEFISATIASPDKPKISLQLPPLPTQTIMDSKCPEDQSLRHMVKYKDSKDTPAPVGGLCIPGVTDDERNEVQKVNAMDLSAIREKSYRMLSFVLDDETESVAFFAEKFDFQLDEAIVKYSGETIEGDELPSWLICDRAKLSTYLTSQFGSQQNWRMVLNFHEYEEEDSFVESLPLQPTSEHDNSETAEQITANSQRKFRTKGLPQWFTSENPTLEELRSFSEAKLGPEGTNQFNPVHWFSSTRNAWVMAAPVRKAQCSGKSRKAAQLIIDKHLTYMAKYGAWQYVCKLILPEVLIDNEVIEGVPRNYPDLATTVWRHTTEEPQWPADSLETAKPTKRKKNSQQIFEEIEQKARDEVLAENQHSSMALTSSTTTSSCNNPCAVESTGISPLAVDVNTSSNSPPSAKATSVKTRSDPLFHQPISNTQPSENRGEAEQEEEQAIIKSTTVTPVSILMNRTAEQQAMADANRARAAADEAEIATHGRLIDSALEAKRRIEIRRKATVSQENLSALRGDRGREFEVAGGSSFSFQGPALQQYALAIERGQELLQQERMEAEASIASGHQLERCTVTVRGQAITVMLPPLTTIPPLVPDDLASTNNNDEHSVLANSSILASSGPSMDKFGYVMIDNCAGQGAFRDIPLTTNWRQSDTVTSISGIDASSKPIECSQIAKFLGTIDVSPMSQSIANVISQAKAEDAGHEVISVKPHANKPTIFKLRLLGTSDWLCFTRHATAHGYEPHWGRHFTKEEVEAYENFYSSNVHDYSNPAPRVKILPTIDDEQLGIGYKYTHVERAMPVSVQEKLKEYTVKERKEALEAHQYGINRGFLTARAQLLETSTGDVLNSPITLNHIKRSLEIWGDPPALHKGKMVRGAPAPAETDRLLRELTTHESQIIEFDLFYVQGLAFSICVFCPLGHPVVAYLVDRTAKHILQAITDAILYGRANGINITAIRSDNEKGVIASLEATSVMGIPLDFSPPGEAVPRAEKKIKPIKNIVRAYKHHLCFDLPKLVLIMLVFFACRCVAATRSPRTPHKPCTLELVEGYKKNALDYKHTFGTYCQALVLDPDNSMKERSVSGMVLYATGGASRQWWIWQFTSKSLVKRTKFVTYKYWPQEAIKFVNQEASKDWLPRATSSDAKAFAKRAGLDEAQIYDSDQEEQADPDAEALDEFAQAAPLRLVQPGHQHDPANPARGQVPHRTTAFPPLPPAIRGEISLRSNDSKGQDENPFVQTQHTYSSRPLPHAYLSNVSDFVDDQQKEAHSYTTYDPYSANSNSESLWWDVPTTTHDPVTSTVGSRTRSKAAMTSVINLAKIVEEPYTLTAEDRSIALEIETYRQLSYLAKWKDKDFALVISVQRAFKINAEKTDEALTKELKQMCTKRVFHGRNFEQMTSSERASVLPSFMFLKDKYLSNGEFEKLKARLVAGGHKQDKDIYPYMSSPTAATCSIFAIAAIAAAEERFVASVDIAGAYLNTDIAIDGVPPQFMLLDKLLTSVLCKIDPSYKEFVRHDGCCVVQLDKALYGCIESARLWYNDLSSTLKSMGFKQNAADMCVFNLGGDKTVNQCTVGIHVDNMMITCQQQAIIDRVVQALLKRYPDGLTYHAGPNLSFLGMTFDFSTKGEVKITQEGFIRDLLRDSEVEGEARSPAAENLFVSREDGPSLSKEKQEWFHSYAAKCLYLAKRTKPETLVAAATRVTKSNQDDLVKLHRLIKYIRKTKDTGIILRPGKLGMTVRCYVDAAYGLYSDGKSVTGCSIVLGDAGPLQVKSAKQPVVSKSSMEAELIALSDSANQPFHIRYFLVEQGYSPGPITIYQVNISAMHLINKGRSTSERTRHIAIRYFWIKERVDTGEVRIEYLASADMIADALTKPLQGAAFDMERKRLTNWPW